MQREKIAGGTPTPTAKSKTTSGLKCPSINELQNGPMKETE